MTKFTQTDFYSNPPKTKQDIKEYLTSWLNKVDNQSPLTINGETFVQEYGFRRAFYNHCVLRNILTNEYIWWVFEEFDLKSFPKKRFSTYELMLEDVINDYYIGWKLDENTNTTN